MFMDLSQKGMCLLCCQLSRQQCCRKSQEKDRVAETSHYLLRVILSRDRQRGLLLLQGGYQGRQVSPGHGMLFLLSMLGTRMSFCIINLALHQKR